MIGPSDCVMIVCASEANAVPGKWDVCCECAREIYLSQSSLNSVQHSRLTSNRLNLYCIDCAMPLMKTVKHFIPLTKEQIQEINKIAGNGIT